MPPENQALPEGPSDGTDADLVDGWGRWWRAMHVGPVLGFLRKDADGILKQRVLAVPIGSELDEPLSAWFFVGNANNQWAFFDRKYESAQEGKQGYERLLHYVVTDLDLVGPGPWKIICISQSKGFAAKKPFSPPGVMTANPLPDVAQLPAGGRHSSRGAWADDFVSQWFKNLNSIPELARSMAFVSLEAARCCQGPSEQKAEPFCFVMASCRYPSVVFERNQVDEKLAWISRNHQHLAMSLFLGDSIYADAAVNIATQRSENELWKEAYIKAYRSPGMQEALSKVPSYFIADDHEFSNDWAAHPCLVEAAGNSGLRPEKDAERRRQFKEAFNAFELFEWWHGPRQDLVLPPSPRTALNPSSLTTDSSADLILDISGLDMRWGPHGRWAKLEVGGCPMFLMDTRSERTRGWDDGQVPLPGNRSQKKDQIVSDEQLEDLANWLALHRGNTRPVFIASGSPVAPLPVYLPELGGGAGADDTWASFPSQFLTLLALLASENAPKNIVLLAGDAHIGMDATLGLSLSGPNINHQKQVRCLISSGIYRPLPAINSRPSDYPQPGVPSSPRHFHGPFELNSGWAPALAPGIKPGVTNSITTKLSVNQTVHTYVDAAHIMKLRVDPGAASVVVSFL